MFIDLNRVEFVIKKTFADYKEYIKANDLLPGIDLSSPSLEDELIWAERCKAWENLNWRDYITTCSKKAVDAGHTEKDFWVLTRGSKKGRYAMDILRILNENYPIHFDRDEMMRDAGNVSYTVFSRNDRYFLRIIKPAFLGTAINGTDIQVFLQNKGFPVPPVIFTRDNLPYVKTDNGLFILYDFVEGSLTVLCSTILLMT